MSAEVRLENVRKTFALGRDQSVTAVGGVDLHLSPGSLTALTGPSGSGKSTLLHVIGSIERADAGSRVLVDGLELTRATRRELTVYRRSVGFVFQRFHLLPALSALENVMAPVIPQRDPGFDKRERAASLLAAVGLAGRERSLPSQLSGGQQQRVAIARALINRPSLLLADEPTGNLDSGNGAAILQLLLELREQHEVTVVLNTHDRNIAEHCDIIVELADGRAADRRVVR